MEKIFKFMDVDVEKAAGSERQMWFTASTEHRDRQGDVLVADAWKLQNYKKNPVFLWAHDYSRPPIGKSVETTKGDGRLRIKVEFVPPEIDPFSEQVRRLYAEGFMRTVSVGFMTYKAEDLTEEDMKQRPEMRYGRRLSGELLEVSAVPVPANPMALQNGFLEAVAKGMTRNALSLPDGSVKSVSKLLRVDSPEMVRASMLALMGARGGIGLNEEERKSQFAILQEIAAQQGLGEFVKAAEWGKSLDDLREQNADIWSGALLDVIQHAKEQAGEDEDKKAMDEKVLNGLVASMKQTAEAINSISRLI